MLAEAQVQLDRGVGLRTGQAAFNALEVVAPREVVDQVRGTAIDPYFDDRCLDAFYTWAGLHDYR